MQAQQLLLAEAQAHLSGVPRGQPGALDLHADELGAVVLAVLCQPVGVGEAGQVVVNVGDDHGLVVFGHQFQGQLADLHAVSFR